MAGHSIFRQFATGRPDDEGKAELIEIAGNDDCSGCVLCAKECPVGRKGNHLVYPRLQQIPHLPS